MGRLQLRRRCICLTKEWYATTFIPLFILKSTKSEARDTKLGPEEITRDIPNVGEDAPARPGRKRYYPYRRRGSVQAIFWLVRLHRRVKPSSTAEERLLRAIFGEKAREVRDTSLRVPHGEYGIIVDVKVFTRENSDELSSWC